MTEMTEEEFRAAAALYADDPEACRKLLSEIGVQLPATTHYSAESEPLVSPDAIAAALGISTAEVIEAAKIAEAAGFRVWHQSAGGIQ